MKIENPVTLPSKSKIDDIKLIDSAIAGNQASYEKLMKKYYQLIYNLVYRMISKKEDVEDLTQEAFIKAFNSLPNFDKQFAFSTWLFKIANNHCIDYLRKQKKDPCSRDKSQPAGFQPDIVDQSFGPEENFIREQRQRLMRDLVDKLNPRYRQLIKLRFFEELSYEEIATQLNMPLGTVKAGIFRAKDLLYLILKNSREI